MEHVFLLVDGGTTNTRFTLIRGREILERRTAAVGAANADAAHRNPALREAVRSAATELPRLQHVSPELICLSGMITSENGLACVPHLNVPAGRKRLAQGIFRTSLPELPGLPVWCIPGVRTLAGGIVTDMMRGEETEVMGDLADHPAEARRLYVHFGSHNKAILTDHGSILGSETTVSGELFAASVRDTILRSSAGEPDESPLDANFVRRGYRQAADRGLPGAMFRARMCAVMEEAQPVQVRSFLYGAFAQQDSLCFRAMLDMHPEEIVVYGRETMGQAWRICMEGQLDGARIRTISHDGSELLSVRGACAILEELMEEREP